MDKKEIFISYRSTEAAHAYYIKDFLETNGFSVWMAPESIPGGSDYATEIPVAIKNCTAVVLILSKKAQRSKWVRKEINAALEMSKTLMPFMIENCKLNEEFNFYLSNVQRYEAFKNKSEVLRNMFYELCRITDREIPDVILDPPAPPEPELKPAGNDFTETKSEAFIIKFTPYGRKRAREPKVRTTLHAASIVLASLALPALSTVMPYFFQAPIVPLLIFAGFMASWYISYGICLLLSRLNSKFAAIALAVITTSFINIVGLLILAFIIPAIMR